MSYYLRFLLFLILLTICGYFVWFGLKSYGESQPVSSYQTLLVERLSGEDKPILWSESSKAPFQHITAIYKSGSWVTSEELPLKSALEASTGNFVLLNIDLGSARAIPRLREILKTNDIWKNLVICSSADGILTDIRELEPEWTFCSGEIFMTQLLALSSLKLQSLIKVKADIFYVHLNNLKLTESLIPMILEAKRQNKLVFIGPVTSPLQGFPADGWVVKK